jgi:hypothetical protein
VGLHSFNLPVSRRRSRMQRIDQFPGSLGDFIDCEVENFFVCF